MISLRALFDLVTLPIKLLLALLKYPIFGGVNKRYKNDLANSLKVILCRSLINFPVKDTPIFATTPTGDMINKGIGKIYPNLTKLHILVRSLISKVIGLLKVRTENQMTRF